MHSTVRDFRLVLCADVWDAVEETSVGMLKKAVAAEKATRGFTFNDLSEPMVVLTFTVRGDSVLNFRKSIVLLTPTPGRHCKNSIAIETQERLKVGVMCTICSIH